MDRLENIEINRDRLFPYPQEVQSLHADVTRSFPMLRREVVAIALRQLWHNLGLMGEPLLFTSPSHRRMQTEFHPLLLDQLVTQGARRKKSRSGQLTSWRSLPAPDAALGISMASEVDGLYKPDLLWKAVIGDRRTVPSAPYSWLEYTLTPGWTALSVMYILNEDGETGILTAIPQGRQDDWLAFLKLLDDLHDGIVRRERRGRIEIIGGDDDLADVIKRASFNSIVLHQDVLKQVSAQRRIFDTAMLSRYEALHVPRLRKVLLIGPPGTGKTTLLKAEGAHHAKHGGLVFYVCAPPKNRMSSSWQQLAQALHSGAESRLPTMVLVEDFEMFVSDPQELQLVLNTLDGVATPDNEAGTLLLATSNDPEKIDQRIRDRPGRIDMLIEVGLVEDIEMALRFLRHFLGEAYREEEHAQVASLLLKQPGSHFREVCIAGAMRALDRERDGILAEDLFWANDMILNGRAVASSSERFIPSSVRKKGNFFGKN